MMNVPTSRAIRVTRSVSVAITRTLIFVNGPGIAFLTTSHVAHLCVCSSPNNCHLRLHVSCSFTLPVLSQRVFHPAIGVIRDHLRILHCRQHIRCVRVPLHPVLPGRVPAPHPFGGGSRACLSTHAPPPGQRRPLRRQVRFVLITVTRVLDCIRIVMHLCHLSTSPGDFVVCPLT